MKARTRGTLERIVPEELEPLEATGAETLQLHLERYTFAAQHARPGQLLDVACGTGYGTALIAAERSDIGRAIGVDVSLEAIARAGRREVRSGVAFVTCDAMQFVPDTRFDTIVSLETIEHLREPEAFVRRVAGWLAPGGVLIASVPVTPSMDGNPHHLADFTARSFRRMGRRCGLVEVTAMRQVQPFSAAAVATGSETRLERGPGDLIRFYAAHPLKLAARVGATLRYGFANHYLTVVWTRG